MQSATDWTSSSTGSTGSPKSRTRYGTGPRSGSSGDARPRAPERGARHPGTGCYLQPGNLKETTRRPPRADDGRVGREVLLRVPERAADARVDGQVAVV